MNRTKSSLLALFASSLALQAQMVQPPVVSISNRTYQVVYNSNAQLNKQTTAILQDATGTQGTALFVLRSNYTTATIYLKSGDNYLLTQTSSSTNLVLLPKVPRGTTDAVTNPPSGTPKAQLIKSASLKAADASSPVTIDVLVLYTAAAAANVGGSQQVSNKAVMAVAEANQVYIDSQVYITLNLVGVVPVSSSYRETDSLATELGRLSTPADGYMDEAQALREQYTADLVCLFVYDHDPMYAGMAYQITDSSDMGYSVVRIDSSVGNYVFVHELGHNMGCAHDVANSGMPGYYSYSYGWRWNANGLTWATVMSYPPGIRMGYFSNPSVSFLGVPTGDATAANNALSLNNRAASVAAWRNPPTYIVTIATNGTGSIVLDGTNVTGAVSCIRGGTLNMTAVGNFVMWSGDQTSTSSNLQVAVLGNTTITANFQDGSLPLAPVIVTQPASQNVPYLGTLTLTASAVGIPAPAYSWFKDGAPLGKCSSTVTFTNADTNLMGLYQCTVSNSVAVVQSAQVRVNVGNPPGIVQQPVYQVAEVGGNALFSVVIDTFGATYQWFANGSAIPGATNRQLLLTGIQTTDMTSYFVDVSTPPYIVRSASADLLLATPPNITQQPQRTSVTKGQTASLNVTATGFTPLRYQWFLNGTSLAGQTNSNLTIANAQSSNGGTYQVQISNPQGIVTSTNATLVVYDPLAITLQPTNIVVVKGTTPIFYVTSTGSAPITYQWFCNGVALTNQVYSSCRLQNVQVTNAGSYYVTVKNPAGSLNSTTVTLTVLDPPMITQNPQNTTVDLNSAATFSVAATGRTPMSYQWAFGGTAIPGATANTFTITNVVANNAGSYTVTVTNADGKATSGPGTLIINLPPTIITQPQSYTSSAGGAPSFLVGATGAGPLSYYWTLNGTTPVGGNSSTLTLLNVQTNQAGSYTVTVSNRLGTCTSSAATLTVKDPPRITMPGSISADEGGTLAIAPTYAGKGPMTYSWSKNGTPLPGQTSSALAITPAQESDGGYYTVTANNPDGSVTTPSCQVSVFLAPKFTVVPASQTVPIGNGVTFSSTTKGGSPLSFQWAFQGTNVVNATNAFLTIASAGLANEGNYILTLSNRLGTTSSPPAQLSISYPPVITTQPVPATVVQGGATSFSVVAQGRNPLSYCWKLNNVAIGGATSNTFNLSNAQSANAGNYQVVITNSDGVANSAVVALSVIIPPVITTQPVDVSSTKGSGCQFTAAVSSGSPCTYQWTYNGNDIAGATSLNLVLNAVQLNQAGNYQMRAVNTAGTTSTRIAVLTVKDPPVFTVQPLNTTVRLGDTLTLSTSASSSVTPISYQWYKNSIAITGKTGTALVYSNVDSTISGSYMVKASNSDGNSSTTATVSFQTQPPVVTNDLPSAFAVDPNATLTLAVGVQGRSPFTYSWTCNGTNLASQTTATEAELEMGCFGAGISQASLGKRSEAPQIA